jgi:hypothetical protein
MEAPGGMRQPPSHQQFQQFQQFPGRGAGRGGLAGGGDPSGRGPGIAPAPFVSSTAQSQGSQYFQVSSGVIPTSFGGLAQPSDPMRGGPHSHLPQRQGFVPHHPTPEGRARNPGLTFAEQQQQQQVSRFQGNMPGDHSRHMTHSHTAGFRGRDQFQEHAARWGQRTADASRVNSIQSAAATAAQKAMAWSQHGQSIPSPVSSQTQTLPPPQSVVAADAGGDADGFDPDLDKLFDILEGQSSPGRPQQSSTSVQNSARTSPSPNPQVVSSVRDSEPSASSPHVSQHPGVALGTTVPVGDSELRADSPPPRPGPTTAPVGDPLDDIVLDDPALELAELRYKVDKLQQALEEERLRFKEELTSVTTKVVTDVPEHKPSTVFASKSVGTSPQRPAARDGPGDFSDRVPPAASAVESSLEHVFFPVNFVVKHSRLDECVQCLEAYLENPETLSESSPFAKSSKRQHVDVIGGPSTERTSAGHLRHLFSNWLSGESVPVASWTIDDWVQDLIPLMGFAEEVVLANMRNARGESSPPAAELRTCSAAFDLFLEAFRLATGRLSAAPASTLTSTAPQRSAVSWVGVEPSGSGSFQIGELVGRFSMMCSSLGTHVIVPRVWELYSSPEDAKLFEDRRATEEVLRVICAIIETLSKSVVPLGLDETSRSTVLHASDEFFSKALLPLVTGTPSDDSNERDDAVFATLGPACKQTIFRAIRNCLSVRVAQRRRPKQLHLSVADVRTLLLSVLQFVEFDIHEGFGADLDASGVRQSALAVVIMCLSHPPLPKVDADLRADLIQFLSAQGYRSYLVRFLHLETKAGLVESRLGHLYAAVCELRRPVVQQHATRTTEEYLLQHVLSQLVVGLSELGSDFSKRMSTAVQSLKTQPSHGED